MGNTVSTFFPVEETPIVKPVVDPAGEGPRPAVTDPVVKPVVDPVVEPVEPPTEEVPIAIPIAREPAPVAHGPPIAFINCGSAGQGFESNDLVSVFGKSYAFSNPSVDVTAENPDFASFGRSHRWASNDFGYTINVPVPGEYDVTLVFCETFKGNFAIGKRVFDVAIHGLQTYEYTNIDVFDKAGGNTVYKINIQNVKVDSQLQIVVKKGTAENPFISGLVIGAVENPKEAKPRPTIPEPDVIVTQEQYNDCIQKIDNYITNAKASAPSAIREVPTFMFHEAGTKIRGLIVTFHGFAGRHYDHRILNRYLYDQGYDIFNTMLAGHMFTGHYWPTTKLSEAFGGSSVAQDIFKSEELATLLQQAQENPALIPRLLTKLRQVNPDFERVMSAQDYMTSLDQDEDPNFSKFFNSTHRDYANVGTEQLRLLDAHPGPVHVTGLSVGGAAALSVASMNPDRITRCIAMAPLMELYEEYPGTKRSLVNYIGPLSVAKDFAWDPATPFPVSAFTAAGRHGGSLTSSAKYQGVFKSKQVQMFMILTEDEDAADIPTNKKFYSDCGGGESGHEFFIYPFNYAVPHPLLDPTARSRGLRNAFYKALYQTVYTFFTVGYADPKFLLRNTEDPSLPSPPIAVHGKQGYYGKAAQTGRHTATN